MTFDLFAAPEPAVADRDPHMDGMLPPPAAPVKRSRAEGEAFVMQPTGDVNRWLYQGEIVVFDNRRKPGSGLGIWRTVEGIGKPVLHGDDRIEVCRAIDARLATENPQ